MTDQNSVPHTSPQVFIIESVSIGDENNNLFEGRVLSEMLSLSGKSPKYMYFRTEAELVEIAKIFIASKFRYLHLSCHASSDTIAFTFGEISYDRFAEIFDGAFRGKRVFISACELGNEGFSQALSARNKGMQSITAPYSKIAFNRAAAFWSAFYVLIFDHDQGAMKSEKIKSYLKGLADLFTDKFHFSRYNPYHDKWRHEIIEPREPSFESNNSIDKSID